MPPLSKHQTINTKHVAVKSAIFLLMLLLVTTGANAETAFESGPTRLSNQELSTLRGGFEMPSGLRLSFGFQQRVVVNDMVTIHNVINIPDIGRAIRTGMSSSVARDSGMREMQQSKSGSAPVQPVPVIVQVGSGNFISPDAFQRSDGSSGFRTVIQNTMDNQAIQNLSIYDFAISNIGSLRSVATNRLLSQQLIGSIRR